MELGMFPLTRRESVMFSWLMKDMQCWGIWAGKLCIEQLHGVPFTEAIKYTIMLSGTVIGLHILSESETFYICW